MTFSSPSFLALLDYGGSSPFVPVYLALFVLSCHWPSFQDFCNFFLLCVDLEEVATELCVLFFAKETAISFVIHPSSILFTCCHDVHRKKRSGVLILYLFKLLCNFCSFNYNRPVATDPLKHY